MEWEGYAGIYVLALSVTLHQNMQNKIQKRDIQSEKQNMYFCETSGKSGKTQIMFSFLFSFIYSIYAH